MKPSNFLCTRLKLDTFISVSACALLVTTLFFMHLPALAQASPTGGAVFNVFSGGSIVLGDRVNTQAYCNFSFYDSPTLNVSKSTMFGSTVCKSKPVSGEAANTVTASGNNVQKLSLPPFQASGSPLDVNYANSAQVLVNDGSRTQQINGNGQLNVISAGQTLRISKAGNVVTLPAGEYARVNLQVNGILHFQSGSSATRIKQLNLANCNGMSMEFEPGDYYIDKLTIQTGCHLTVMPPSAGNGSRSDVNFYLNQAFTLNAGPTCWNMSPGTCNSNIGIPEIQAQHPERLKLFVYQGDFTTYQGAKLAAGLYVAQGAANFVGAGNSAFIGEIYANTISTANGGPTAYAYRPVFTAPPPPTPPVVSLQPTPPGVTYIAPATITLAANANANGANNAITLVQFFQGGSLIGSTTTPTSPNGSSYSIVWDKVPANTYSITAKATDSAGNTSTSSPLIINVINNNPPVISLTASPLNSTAPASITLTANASDSDGTISKVDFFNGTTNIASLTQPPFTTQWNNVSAGSYTLTVTATDNLGASTVSSPVTITVTSHVAKVFDIHTDHLNTPRVITDSNGNPVWRWDSAPFGETLPDENPQKTGSTGNFVFNLRFAGQYFDRETNLHYNYFRDYDPQTGRYIQSDPIGLDGGMNTYGYVGGNPVENTDTFGLASQCYTGLGALGNLDLGPIFHSYSKYTDSKGVVQRVGFGRDTTNDSIAKKIAGVALLVKGSIIKGEENINEEGAKCTPDDGNKCMDKCLERSWKETENNLPKYGWIFGSTCQSVQANIWATCQRQCSKR